MLPGHSSSDDHVHAKFEHRDGVRLHAGLPLPSPQIELPVLDLRCTAVAYYCRRGRVDILSWCVVFVRFLPYAFQMRPFRSSALHLSHAEQDHKKRGAERVKLRKVD